jgi:hypothetical protein
MQSGQKVMAKPNKGVTFRKENGEFIKPEGEVVELNSFWIRRRNDGDVTLSEIPKIKQSDTAK